jgi:hypothetical protein
MVIAACSSDDPEFVIPDEFTVYVDRFVSEARDRGITINVDNLDIKFVGETDPPGFCGFGLVDPPRVQIKQSDGCWNLRTDIEKEILVFHELGHAILRRGHINDKLPNGDFKSLMFDGNQFSLYNQYTPEKRKYYLDELFNPLTLEPSWSDPKTIEVEIFNDSIKKVNSWHFFNVQPVNHNGIVTNLAFASSTHSLSINSSTSSPEGFSSWSYHLSPSNIPVGSALVLKAKIKMVDLTGNGVYMAMRGDTGNSANFFITTQGSKTIMGTQDFYEYSVKLNYFPGQVSSLYIYLLLDGTATGSVYFDDISIINYR